MPPAPALARSRAALSHATGWLADRGVPRFLRRPVYGAYCLATGARADEAELPLSGYPSLGAFFVRRLKRGARPIDPDPLVLVAPCDGTLQAAGGIQRGRTLAAKGREYDVDELLAGAGRGIERGVAITIYLSPRDYHRVHAPLAARLVDVRWVPGDRRSVAPRTVARVPRLFATNERAVLCLESDEGPWFLVMVGALNVGRIRVVGVEPGGAPLPGARFERGAELARFEMGSTVVLVLPSGMVQGVLPIEPGGALRLGQPIARLAPAEPAPALPDDPTREIARS